MIATQVSFRRISKQVAFNRFVAGLPVVVIPCKLYPTYGPFRVHCELTADILGRMRKDSYGVKTDREHFEEYLDNFNYFNASYETGKYPHFYIEERPVPRGWDSV